jgi:hypothetical protein
MITTTQPGTGPQAVADYPEPHRCTCTVFVVGDLADTLLCPAPWQYVESIGRWVHSYDAAAQLTLPYGDRRHDTGSAPGA